jgi:hypothetical protein
MPKEFYTERDIEDMWKRGIMSLQVTENVVLTELAYEKAQRLGMQLLKENPLEPPAAPVRPYLSQAVPPLASSYPPSMPIPSASPAPIPAQPDLTARIRSAVIAKLGTQIDSQLLDVIIQRVLQSTGVK